MNVGTIQYDTIYARSEFKNLDLAAFGRAYDCDRDCLADPNRVYRYVTGNLYSDNPSNISVVRDKLKNVHYKSVSEHPQKQGIVLTLHQGVYTDLPNTLKEGYDWYLRNYAVTKEWRSNQFNNYPHYVRKDSDGNYISLAMTENIDYIKTHPNVIFTIYEL